MKFVEIVETVEGIESKLGTLSEEKLGLLESILVEGADTAFDVVNHIDYLVEYVNSYTDENAQIIAETVDCGKVLGIILESARKHTTDTEAFLVEAVEKTEEIDIELLAEDDATASVTLLSVVTNTLTEMLGEEAVESMPAEMVFDIVESAKELDLADNAEEMDIVSLVEEISTKLEESIKDGSIDLDSDDYKGETLSEFLEDYTDTDDLLEEMTKVTDEILAESENEDAARLMGKAKDATIMLEAKKEKCAPGDMKCMINKAKKAKEWFLKNKHPSGIKPEEMKVGALTGRLGKHTREATKAFKKKHGKAMPKDYIQFVLVPGIIAGMRAKGKKRKASEKVLKQGQRA